MELASGFVPVTKLSQVFPEKICANQQGFSPCCAEWQDVVNFKAQFFYIGVGMQLFRILQVGRDLELIYWLPGIPSSHIEVEDPVMATCSIEDGQRSAFSLGSNLEGYDASRLRICAEMEKEEVRNTYWLIINFAAASLWRRP